MTLFTGVLVLAIILPISLSIWQVTRQAKLQFYCELDDYSNRIVVCTLQVASQAREAPREADSHTTTFCSPEHLLTLRRIIYTHRYIQEVLWLCDSAPQCSSLEDHSAAVTFSPPDHVVPDGYRTWLTSMNDFGLNHQMTIMGSQQHMVVIDLTSFIDMAPVSEEKIHTMLSGLDHLKMVTSSQSLPDTIQQRIKDPHVNTPTLDNTAYRIQRIPELDSDIVTWSSTLPPQRRIRRQLIFRLPIDVFTSLLATWLLLCLLRHLRLSRDSMLDAFSPEAIQVYYQSTISLQDGKIAGAETLARWQQPGGTSLSPDIFIPLAEQTGLITQLAEDTVRKIFTDLGLWLQQRLEVHISINLPIDDLCSLTLLTLLHNQPQHRGIAVERIIPEITERGFVDLETTIPAIAHYRQAGHRVSIDDFGIDYFSLGYLQKLDVDTLKIGKSFVDTLKYRPLTLYIIETTKALNLAAVAGGVETESQRDRLRQHGAQYAQGWPYSKALPKEQFILWAENNLHVYQATGAISRMPAGVATSPPVPGYYFR